MELIKLNYNETLTLPTRVVAAIGQFDGLHLGHMKLIEKAKEIANSENIKAGIITFDPHPDFVLKKRQNYGYITPLPQKLSILEQLGIDYVIIINFTVELSQMIDTLFYERFLSTLDTIVIGSDYRYGYMGKGNVDTLKATGKKIEVIELVKVDNEKIGSNKIRELIMNGNVDQIYLLMHRYYNITGIVTHGDKVGRTLGIRTANINLDEAYQLIKKGVYAVYVHIGDKCYLGVGNIGNNPSINYVQKMRLEVHIFDFEGEIYGQNISVDFLCRIRDELYFETKEQLVTQIMNDIHFVKERYGKQL